MSVPDVEIIDNAKKESYREKVLDTENNIKRSVESPISKKVVAQEIVFWLRKAEIAGLIAVVAPFAVALFTVFDLRIGLVVALAGTIGGVLYYRQFMAERKRLVDTYEVN